MVTSQFRLLIVDDEPLVRQMMSDLLVSRGYEVLTAQDGFDALSQLEGRLPDLIISDLKMPRMSGFELLAIIRQRFPQLPTIAISGDLPPDPSSIGLVADELLSKGSYTNDQLASVIAKLISASSGRAQPTAIDVEQNWIPRDAEGYLLMKCRNCLRSFPLQAGNLNGGLHKIACPSCQANLRFRIDHRKNVFPRSSTPCT